MHNDPFGGRVLPGPPGEAYSAPPDLLAGFDGGGRKGGRREGRGKRGRGKGGKYFGPS